jgi:electron transfer flavoprotein alpha subunit
MATLVFLEHHEGELQKGSLGVLGKAAKLEGGDVAAVVVGSGVKDLAAQAGRFGATAVFVADDPAFEKPLPQPRVDALAQVVRDNGFDTVVFAASVLSADVAAGLAARLDAGLNWDLVDLVREDGRLVGKRPAFGDTVVADVGWTSEPRLALIRSGTFEPKETGGEADVRELDVQLEDFSSGAVMVEQAHEESSGPSIEDADVIVAGGRGLGGPEKFSLVGRLRPLARSSTPAGTRTRPRSARRARPWRRSSTSPAGSRARSSTRSGCRARARSWPSTRIRTRRSSTSPTSGSSAT